MKQQARTADPFRDLALIDSRAPRTNQAIVALVAVLALATGWWWLLALLAGQLAVGLLLGRRFCLPCLLYFGLIQPLFGEGPLEDARPPRVANMIGFVFLALASLAYGLDLPPLGLALGAPVATLAALAAITGFCTGCELYKLGCRLRGTPFVACPLPPRVEREQRLAA